MNWYKTAKDYSNLSEKGLKPQDVMSFYALQSLSNEGFKEHPDLLYDFVEQLNVIREYYLDFLLPRIARELYHSMDETAEALEYSWDYDYDYLSLEDFVVEMGWEDKDENRQQDEYLNFLESNNATVCSLPSGTQREISYLATDLEHGKNINVLNFDRIIFFFKDLDWTSGYGGETWAEITEWTKQLYLTPPINIQQNFNLLLPKARELAVLIDTINSVCHNSDLLLRELFGYKGVWFKDLLDIVKYSPSKLGLSYFSRNPKIMRALYEDAKLEGFSPYGQIEFVVQLLQNMRAGQRFQFLSRLHYLPFLSVLINRNVDVELLLGLIVNPIAKDFAPSLLTEAIEKIGVDQVWKELSYYARTDFMKNVIAATPLHIQQQIAAHKKQKEQEVLHLSEKESCYALA